MSGLSSSRAIAAFSLAAALLSACAVADGPDSASQASGRSCFLPSQVNGFHAVDRDTVHVNVGVNQVYELQLFGNCTDINWSQRIGIRSTGGSSWVCQGMDAELIVPSVLGPQQCQIQSIRRLSEEEARAIRAARD